MAHVGTGKVVRREYKYLGELQTKILEFLLSQKEGATTAQIFEEVYNIPLSMGTIFPIYADIKISPEKLNSEIGVRGIRASYLDLAARIEGHLDSENEESLIEERSIRRLTGNIHRNIRNFDTYLKMISLDTLRTEFEARVESVNDNSDLHKVVEDLRDIVSKTIRLGESTEGYRKEMRAMRAAGQGRGEDAEQRRALSNTLRANLGNSLSTLKTRGLVAEAAMPEESYWRGIPSRFFITKQGYTLLQGRDADED